MQPRREQISGFTIRKRKRVPPGANAVTVRVNSRRVGFSLPDRMFVDLQKELLVRR